MGSFVSAIVFQPPGEDSIIAFTNLLRCRDAMRYVDLVDGSRVSYIVFHPQQERYPFVMLYSHGNAEHLGVCAAGLQYLSDMLGLTIVGYDYRGYGYSGPITAPSEDSVYEDADAMYAHLTGTGPRALNYPESKVIIMGRSVGGGPATYLAEKHHEHIAGLILQSTFTSCLRVPNEWCLACFCCCLDLFDNASRIGHVTRCPILLMHGDQDSVVPFRCSQKLCQIACKARGQEPVLVDDIVKSPQPQQPVANAVYFRSFAGCNHNDIEALMPREFYGAMQSFLAALVLH